MKKPRRRGKKQPRANRQSVEALREMAESFIPEFAARLAAVEYLLVEKNICTYEALREARKFVDMKVEMEKSR